MEDHSIDLLPYRAEYAKSGRSSCKGCKTSIAKEELRLAVMVQSPLFDGKVPHWYHVICFFGKQRPKAPGDIAHLDSLRWEDQEKIKEKIAQPPALTATGKKASKRSKGAKSEFQDFTVEYAKSSRAMCRGCEIKLAKGEVRISKKDFESDNAKMYGGQDRWHHIECFTKLRNDLEFFASGDFLPGFTSLKKEDQATVKTALPKITPTTIKDEVDGGAPKIKKIKEEDVKKEPKTEDDKLLRKQNEKMFSYRDALKQLKQSQLSELLSYNKQEDAVGIERKLDRLADAMTFGSLAPCSVCKGGQLVYSTGFGYKCTGDLTEWTKCTNVETEPKRNKFRIPSHLSENFAFLDSYKPKLGTRILPKELKSSTVNSEPGSSRPKLDRFAPFKGMTFFVVGKTKEAKTDLRKKIEQWGGKVSSKLNDNVSVIISNKGEVEKMSEKMLQAKELDIVVVPESYIEACSTGNAVDRIVESSISSWGANPKARIQQTIAKSEALVKSTHGKSRFDLKSGSKVVLKVKGGSAVDPDSNLEDVCHVYSEGKNIYNAVLGLSDVQTNKNSYYKIQLLSSDKRKEFWVFRSWGRIGTSIGGNTKKRYSSIHEAKEAFKAVYLDETGNSWDNRDNFVKYPDRMYPIDIDYGQSDTIQMSSESSVQSKLDKPVQELIQMLFDVEIMKKVMLEFELDLEKMPLGKLSKKQIQKAYSVLSELQQKDGDIKPTAVIDASNRFYTLIPHNFGTKSATLLDSKEIIQSKLEMLESLLEMEVAYSLLKETKGEGDDTQHPLDAHYSKLNTEIKVMDRKSEEYLDVEKYVTNTHAETHSSYSLEILEAFKVCRNGESKRYKPFKKLHNRKLLWHGSRSTNFAGILSHGLRIAPPEAPVTGYMFGKGIYFADMVSKSANYCMTSSTNPNGLLLLCEVALGNMYERTRADFIEKLPTGTHSTKGLGVTCPDPSLSKITPDGVEIPFGTPMKVLDRSQTSLLYNEYIVYDVAQVKAEYLVKVKFNYTYGK